VGVAFGVSIVSAGVAVLSVAVPMGAAELWKKKDEGER